MLWSAIAFEARFSADVEAVFTPLNRPETSNCLFVRKD